MTKTKSLAQAIYELAVAATAFAGIFMGITARSGMTTISYYTNQSNLACALLFAVLGIYRLCGRRFNEDTYQAYKGAIMMCITVTFLVFHFMLRPSIAQSGADYNFMNMENIILHYIVPIAVILDYVIFDKKGLMKWFYPLLWVIIPLSYPLFVVVYNICGGTYPSFGGVSSRVPYFFLDIDNLGWGGVLAWVAFILVAYLVLSYGVVLLDRLFGRLSQKKQKAEI